MHGMKYSTDVLSGAIITRVYGFLLAEEEWGFSSIIYIKKNTALQDYMKKCGTTFTRACATLFF